MRKPLAGGPVAIGPASVSVVYEPTLPLRRRTNGAVAIIIVSVLALCCAGGGVLFAVNAARSGAPNGREGPTGTSAERPARNDGAGAEAAGVGDAVRDGKFEFVVRSVTCGHDSVGSGWWRDEPLGQFCVVELTVTNIGAQAQRFADGQQKAFGPDGDLYAADTGAGVVANGSGDAIWQVVNPGNTLSAKVVYDIPRKATIARLELHDSPFSRGVQVTVPARSG